MSDIDIIGDAALRRRRDRLRRRREWLLDRIDRRENFHDVAEVSALNTAIVLFENELERRSAAKGPQAEWWTTPPRFADYVMSVQATTRGEFTYLWVVFRARYLTQWTGPYVHKHGEYMCNDPCTEDDGVAVFTFDTTGFPPWPDAPQQVSLHVRVPGLLRVAMVQERSKGDEFDALLICHDDEVLRGEVVLPRRGEP